MKKSVFALGPKICYGFFLARCTQYKKDCVYTIHKSWCEILFNQVGPGMRCVLIMGKVKDVRDVLVSIIQALWDTGAVVNLGVLPPYPLPSPSLPPVFSFRPHSYLLFPSLSFLPALLIVSHPALTP